MTVTFDGTELVTGTYTTRFVKHETVADRALDLQPLAGDDGVVLIGERRGSKVIRLQGVIKGSTQANLEAAIDAFTELFSRPEKNLDIDWAGGTRRYVSTCQEHRFDRDHYHLSIVPWSAEFIVPSGEGKDTATTTPTEANATAVGFSPGGADGSTSFPLLGSKPPRPVITIGNIDAGTAVRGIEYKNTDTDERLVITYPGEWGNDRTIIIDCQNKTVTGDVVDGVTRALNFYGVFPRFKIGTNNVQIRPGSIVNQKSADEVIADIDTPLQIMDSTSRCYAQGIMVPYTDETFSGITLAIKKTGTPGTITWRIETDDAGKPSGTLVSAAATGTIAAGSVTTSTTYITGTTTSGDPFTLNANTPYWIVWKAAATLDGSNKWEFGQASEATYPRGYAQLSVDAGSTWGLFATKSDFAFRLLHGGREGTINFAHTVTYYKTYL